MTRYVDVDAKELALMMIADYMSVCSPVTDVEYVEGGRYRVYQKDYDYCLADAPPSTLLLLEKKVAEKLSHLHDMNIIHGDIRLDCIYVRNNKPFIDDYSMSKFVGEIGEADLEGYGKSLNETKRDEVPRLEKDRLLSLFL